MKFRYTFNKLVRSFMVDKRENERKIALSYKILNDEDYKKELIQKFHEEALEVVNSNSRDELIEEIADCFEVVDEILKMNNISKEDILRAQNEKREKIGGFEKKHFINYVEIDEKSEWVEWFSSYKANGNGKERIFSQFDVHIVDFIISDEKERVYVQKRSKTAKSYPDAWELPGGKLEANETFWDCIGRELKEELNLELAEKGRMVYSCECDMHGKKAAYSVFEVKVSEWENFKLEDGKATEFKWLAKNEIETFNIERHDCKTSPVYLALKEFWKL